MRKWMRSTAGNPQTLVVSRFYEVSSEVCEFLTSLLDIFTDAGILKEANDAVTAVFEEDPELSLEKYHPLKKRLAAYMRYDLGNLNL